jgi:hypothetical protein
MGAATDDNQDQQAAALKGKRPFDLAVSDYFRGKNLLSEPSGGSKRVSAGEPKNLFQPLMGTTQIKNLAILSPRFQIMTIATGAIHKPGSVFL